MNIPTHKFIPKEYFNDDEMTDTRYELVNGEVIAIGIETGRHGKIIRFLCEHFEWECDRLNREWVALPGLVGVRSLRAGRWDSCRIPDITVLSDRQWEEIGDREAMIELDTPRPFLVVEVVSQYTKTTDYRAKRSEYAVLDIQEYWIVDPLSAKVTICSLYEGLYEVQEFSRDQVIVSNVFRAIGLTADQILQGKR